jgi:hypothetical protein
MVKRRVMRESEKRAGSSGAKVGGEGLASGCPKRPLRRAIVLHQFADGFCKDFPKRHLGRAIV